jgi:hypothetical protein
MTATAGASARSSSGTLVRPRRALTIVRQIDPTLPLTNVSTQLEQVEKGLLAPRDPVTMIGAIVVMAVVSALAGYLPARRASKVEPDSRAALRRNSSKLSMRGAAD